MKSAPKMPFSCAFVHERDAGQQRTFTNTQQKCTQHDWRVDCEKLLSKSNSAGQKNVTSSANRLS